MSAIAEAPRWDTTVIFPGLESPEFVAAMEAHRAAIDDLVASVGRLGIDRPERSESAPGAFSEFAALYDAVSRRHRELRVYVGCFVDTDSRNETAQGLESRLDKLGVTLEQIGAELIAWVGAQDVEAMIASSSVCADHAFILRKMQRESAHQLSPAEESLALEMRLTGSTAWSKLHGNLCSQIEVNVELPDGVRTLPMSAVRNLAYDASEPVRRAAYEAEIAAWRAHEIPLAAAMNGIKGEVLALARRRGWESPLSEAVFHAHIDEAILDAMMGAARASFPVFRRYLSAKARALGRTDGKLPWHDLFAPLGGDGGDWPYPKGAEFVVRHFRGYSDKMGDFAERAFRENWIDVPPAPGKRDGAYCAGLRRDESRILMNYKPAFGSVSTLAHELGHAYHNLCLAQRTRFQSDTPMTLAETASIFCETIIKRAALQQGTAEEQRAILEASLMGSCQVVVDITSRFLFESRVFEGRAERDLSANELSELMAAAQAETYGDAMSSDHRYMWAVKPHYYSAYSFYNFPYMYGLLFGLGLYARFEQDPEPFRAAYDDLLSSTGMADARELGARFGIAIDQAAFWEASLSVIAEDVARFESLV
jgi:pepF/M3 family oligoendopeptidase